MINPERRIIVIPSYDPNSEPAMTNNDPPTPPIVLVTICVLMAFVVDALTISFINNVYNM